MPLACHKKAIPEGRLKTYVPWGDKGQAIRKPLPG